MRYQQKERYSVHDLCARAAAVLREAGFEKVATSMKTEALYFQLPGRHGLLRIAVHASKTSVIGLGNVVARITFKGNSFDAPDTMRCTEEKIATMIHIGIGQYIVRSATEQPSRYRGKRGTWENDCARG